VRRLTRLFIWYLFALSGLAAGAVIWLHGHGRGTASPAPFLLEEIVRAGGDGFVRPRTPWAFRFPADHGAHLDFRFENWSFHGLISDENGKQYGFQLAFFRLAMVPDPEERSSAWAANQVYRAHFTLTEGPDSRFRAFERLSRAALGLAGAAEDPIRVWVEDWSLEAVDEETFRLRAKDEGVDLELELNGAKPIVRQGGWDLLERPLGGSGGFHFYLMPRLEAMGSLRLAGRELQVSGPAWLDRAWGEVPFAGGQLALNRFEIQLVDGRDLLCLELRRREGGGTPIPSCLLIAADGMVEHFGRRRARLEPEGEWVSPLDGTRFPLRWRLSIPEIGLELTIDPMAENQEILFEPRAWSGAVLVRGSAGGSPVTGRGHLELTGYEPPS